jgi:hypothetical protein
MMCIWVKYSDAVHFSDKIIYIIFAFKFVYKDVKIDLYLNWKN